MIERPDWKGRTVVCIASGPSLTAEDCETAKASGHPAIVTNTTFRLAPWADVILAMDLKWWKEYGAEVKAKCTGRRMSTSHAARAYGAESLWQCGWFSNPLNTGQAAITLAMVSGASKIVLLGYDCQMTRGKSHHHGDHPKHLGNAGSIKRWPKHFEQMARDAGKAGVDVVNCTRATALTCFPRVDLKEAL